MIIIISPNNPILNKLIIMYSIVRSYDYPNEEYKWYDYSGLEDMIFDNFENPNSSCIVIWEFIDYLKLNYKLESINDISFNDGILVISGETN